MLVCDHFPLTGSRHFQLMTKYSCASKHRHFLIWVFSKIVHQGVDSFPLHYLFKFDCLTSYGFFALFFICVRELSLQNISFCHFLDFVNLFTNLQVFLWFLRHSSYTARDKLLHSRCYSWIAIQMD